MPASDVVAERAALVFALVIVMVAPPMGGVAVGGGGAVGVSAAKGGRPADVAKAVEGLPIMDITAIAIEVNPATNKPALAIFVLM